MLASGLSNASRHLRKVRSCKHVAIKCLYINAMHNMYILYQELFINRLDVLQLSSVIDRSGLILLSTQIQNEHV